LKWTGTTSNVVVEGDAERLHQVFDNILGNAIKFTPNGGTVEVSMLLRDSQVVIRIRDNGQGISADLLPRVFDRFRQSDSPGVRKHGGLGLGLAIAKELVILHGGTVSAESRGPGLGSTFTVGLPLA
jgi:signal transduction histidine kinase